MCKCPTYGTIIKLHFLRNKPKISVQGRKINDWSCITFLGNFNISCVFYMNPTVTNQFHHNQGWTDPLLNNVVQRVNCFWLGKLALYRGVEFCFVLFFFQELPLTITELWRCLKIIDKGCLRVCFSFKSCLQQNRMKAITASKCFTILRKSTHNPLTKFRPTSSFRGPVLPSVGGLVAVRAPCRCSNSVNKNASLCVEIIVDIAWIQRRK